MHDLKDVSQALEIMRRTRREMPEGATREALDAQVVALTHSINALVGEDERLAKMRDAEQRLLVAKPKGVNWDMLKLSGELASMIAKVLAGVAVEAVWNEVTKR